MDDAGRGYEVLFDARLVEECVLLQERREHGLRRARFRRERDVLYERGEPEDRERRFEAFHRGWFERMGLARTLLAILDEHPSLAGATRHCIVMPALEAEQEGADLRDERPLTGSGIDEPRHRGGSRGPTLILQIRPQTLVDREALTRLLSHELLHVDDMLDAEFGYHRELRLADGSPARARRVAARYGVLWDCTIDGRLHRGGQVGDETAALRRREFEAAFPEAIDEFRRWFDGRRPTHEAMLAAARDGDGGAPAGICPLCGFACAETVGVSEMPAPVPALVLSDFPDWRPAEGACRQCVDLYAARFAEQFGARSASPSAP